MEKYCFVVQSPDIQRTGTIGELKPDGLEIEEYMKNEKGDLKSMKIQPNVFTCKHEVIKQLSAQR